MLEESLGNNEAVCGSALLNAVTCLARSKPFINLTSQIHTLRALLFCPLFCIFSYGTNSNIFGTQDRNIY